MSKIREYTADDMVEDIEAGLKEAIRRAEIRRDTAYNRKNVGVYWRERYRIQDIQNALRLVRRKARGR